MRIRIGRRGLYLSESIPAPFWAAGERIWSVSVIGGWPALLSRAVRPWRWGELARLIRAEMSGIRARLRRMLNAPEPPALDIGSMLEVVAVDRKTGAITLSQTRDLCRRGMGRVVVGKELPWDANRARDALADWAQAMAEQRERIGKR
ncbi:MAG TPA: hypothetical protein VFJ24_11870 [Gaiellales bacterium]|nr:hypothetical protein [Gaiellales bacterium]